MAYTCTKCNAQFSTREALRQHQFGHLYDGDAAGEGGEPDVPLKNPPDDESERED